MKVIYQNILNGAVAVAIAAGLWSLQPPINKDPHGILLPTSSQRYAAIAFDQVSVYLTAPENYTLVGEVRTNKHFDKTDPTADNHNLNASIIYARQLAAAAGANGLLIENEGTTEGGDTPLDGFIVYARAIRVSP